VGLDTLAVLDPETDMHGKQVCVDVDEAIFLGNQLKPDSSPAVLTGTLDGSIDVKASDNSCRTCGGIGEGAEGCYTTWGHANCRAGYTRVVRGRTGGLEAQIKSPSTNYLGNLQCISDLATAPDANDALDFSYPAILGDATGASYKNLCAICCASTLRSSTYTVFGPFLLFFGFFGLFVLVRFVLQRRLCAYFRGFGCFTPTRRG